LGVAGFSPVIGMVGNLQRWKGQWLLIEAVRKLQTEFPNICCVLIGDVSQSRKHQAYAAELRASIAQHGLEQRILMAGYRQDVPNYLNAFDIIVHASTNPEPFGLVVLEAMAFKKPLVASRAGGVREIVVEGKSGMLFEPGNSDDLARALRELLKDKEAAIRMGQIGYDRLVSEFTIATHVQRVQGVYKKVLQSE
jgi:glycosyltransferase involved in cell wall biosynthesis